VEKIDEIGKAVRLDRSAVRAAEARLAADAGSRVRGNEAAVVARAPSSGLMSWKN